MTPGGRVMLTCLLALAAAGCSTKAADRPREGAAQRPPESSRMDVVNGETGVILDSATIARIGLRTEPLRESTQAPELELLGQVVSDPAGVSFVRAGLAGRLTPAARGWPRYGERLADGEEVGVVGDGRPILVPRGGTVTRVFSQPGELVQAGQELLEVTRFDAPLVRVAWEPEAGSVPPDRLSLATESGGARVQGGLVGPAPEADPITRGTAWLYRVSAGWPSMRPGAAVLGYLPDPRGTRHGVVIPGRVVLQWDALLWAYVERAPGRYVRVHVPTDLPLPDGWLATTGFAAGDRVVTAAAGQLLSEEFRARIVVGEEVGE